ncbi:MAG: hypothetical protein ACRD5B_06925 [Nitrososphaeraceae archaeon]
MNPIDQVQISFTFITGMQHPTEKVMDMKLEMRDTGLCGLRQII